jgi:hypothetical protein
MHHAAARRHACDHVPAAAAAGMWYARDSALALRRWRAARACLALHAVGLAENGCGLHAWPLHAWPLHAWLHAWPLHAWLHPRAAKPEHGHHMGGRRALRHAIRHAIGHQVAGRRVREPYALETREQALWPRVLILPVLPLLARVLRPCAEARGSAFARSIRNR